MKSTNQPVFTNTCGKIYPGRIILASANQEKTLEMGSLSSLSFRSGIALSGLLFAALPAIFFVLIFAIKHEEFYLKVIFAILGTVGVILSLLKAKRSHTLSIKMANGEKQTINVWHGNVKEAKKFADIANKVLKSYRKSELAETDEALEVATATSLK